MGEIPIPTVKVRMEKERLASTPFLALGVFFFPRKGIYLIMNSEKYLEKHLEKIRRLCLISLFAAVAYLTLFVFRIAGIGGFLTFDLKDAVITVAAMLFGPLTGVGLSFLVALLEMITVSGTGPLGALMNFASTAVFSSCAGAVYNYMPKIKRTFRGALAGLASSVVIGVISILCLNLVITPIYNKMPVSAVVNMILPLLLPFNLIKTVLNASVVMMIYKPISTVLRKSRFLSLSQNETAPYRFSGKTLAVFLASAAVAAACVVLLILGMNGTFTLFKK